MHLPIDNLLDNIEFKKMNLVDLERKILSKDIKGILKTINVPETPENIQAMQKIGE